MNVIDWEGEFSEIEPVQPHQQISITDRLLSSKLTIFNTVSNVLM